MRPFTQTDVDRALIFHHDNIFLTFNLLLRDIPVTAILNKARTLSDTKL